MPSIDEIPAFDPRTRTLCPNGDCTGLLDGARVCSECRRTFSSTEVAAARAGSFAPASDDDGVAGAMATPPGSFDHGTPAAQVAGGFDPNRRLCADGACIGVIGSSGRCSTCGKSPENIGD